MVIEFDDMIANMIRNKNANPIVNKLFIKGRKLNINLAFITQSYFAARKDVRQNSRHYFIMKTRQKRTYNKLRKIIY